MKNLISVLFISLSLLSFTSKAQETSQVDTLKIEKASEHFEFKVGIGYVDDLHQFDANFEVQPLCFSAQYRFFKRLSLGANFIWSKSSWFSYRKSAYELDNVWTNNSNRIAYGVFMQYDFVSKKEWMIYGKAGILSQKETISMYRNDGKYHDNDTYYTMNPLFSLGAQYYPINNLGIFTEFGLGDLNAQIGSCFKF